MMLRFLLNALYAYINVEKKALYEGLLKNYADLASHSPCFKLSTTNNTSFETLTLPKLNKVNCK